MLRILITGGAGFIGSHTVDLLLAQGHQVTVFDNLVSGKRDNLHLSHSALTFVEGDILNYSQLKKEIQNCDAVLHLAALPSVPKSIEDPVSTLQINTQGFLHVLQIIREIGRSIRLVYASSAAVYGNAEKLPCSDEVSLPAPLTSPYALEKANCEYYAALYANLFGIKSLGLRYFNVYGARQDPNSVYSGVISRFMRQYRDDAEIIIFGDGKQSRDFIYVGDVARANSLALQQDYCGVLNVATGEPETLLNLVRYIEKAGGKSAKVKFVAERVGDIVHSYATTDSARENIGFSSEVSLRHGIALPEGQNK